MPTPSRHYQEELDALLDGRLDAALHAEVEAHLATCESCWREYQAIRLAKNVAATRCTAPPAPAELREKILRSLRAEPAPATPATVITPPRSIWQRHGLAFAAAALLLTAAVVASVVVFRQPSLPAAVAEDFRAYRAQQLTLDAQTTDVKEMEAYFTAHGVPFATRVFDLGMMDYRLVGGRVHRLGGETSALFVYRGKDGQELVCQMFRGQVKNLPPGAERRENKGIEFFIYRRDGKTTVFWQEGAIVCVLASDIASESVVALASAKAMIP